MLLVALEGEMGAEAASVIDIEVSTPGAERQLRLPNDLERFGQLPLYVEWRDGEGQARAQVCVCVCFGCKGGGEGGC